MPSKWGIYRPLLTFTYVYISCCSSACLSKTSSLLVQHASDYRTHVATHPGGARHSCWTCGAQFTTRTALNEHSVLHAAPEIAGSACRLCQTEFQVQLYVILVMYKYQLIV